MVMEENSDKVEERGGDEYYAQCHIKFYEPKREGKDLANEETRKETQDEKVDKESKVEERSGQESEEMEQEQRPADGLGLNGKPRNEMVMKYSPEEMPRERLKALGAKSLTDVELIQILLRTGIQGVPVDQLARKIYETYNRSIMKMGDAPLNDMLEIKGLGEAKAIGLMAALELGRRRMFEEWKNKLTQLRGSEQAYQYFYPLFGHLETEEVHVVVLNGQNRILTEMTVSQGGYSSSPVDMRTMMRKILTAGGTGFMMAHNHPSGNCRPSKQDLDLTTRVAKASDNLGLNFIDHIIIARGNQSERYYSFADNGLLK